MTSDVWNRKSSTADMAAASVRLPLLRPESIGGMRLDINAPQEWMEQMARNILTKRPTDEDKPKESIYRGP